MAMNAYTGATGAGKTYQVMEHLICVELAQGRSIATNIENIDVDGIYWYILCKNRDEKEKITLPDGRIYERDKIICFGSLRYFTASDIEESGDDFFPNLRHENRKPVYDDAVSFIKNGEYVIIDEAPNWWGNDTKISRRHGQYFREHRHFVNLVTHQTPDIVFLSQDISYLHTSLRRKGGIRFVFWIEKMDMVGLTERYKMLMYRGCSITRNTKPERVEHGKYKEEVYLLYDSYAEGKGKEQIMDARQNVLNNPKKWKAIGIGVLIFLVIAVFMVRSLMGFFNQGKKQEQTAKNPDIKNASGPSAQIPISSPSAPPESDYRAIGWYRIAGNSYALIRGENGIDRTLINPRNWSLETIRYSGSLDGKQIAVWTGKTGEEQKVGR